MTSKTFAIFLSAILVALVFFRLLYSTPIEFNDESILKWQLGINIFETKDWSLLLPKDSSEAHHELRWGIIIPQILLGMVFSDGYQSYYVTPILFFSLFTVFCIALYGREVLMIPYGVLLGLVISFEPMGHVMASQVNTGAFGLLYVIVSFWCLLKYLERGGLEKLLFCALFSFFAYGAHITYLVFWAVPVIFLVINQKDYRAALFFLAFLGIFFVIEIVVLGLISSGEVPRGRVDRIWSIKQSGATHFRGGDPFQFNHFFVRWLSVPKYDLVTLAGFLMGSLSLMFSKVRKQIPAGIWLCFYAASIYGITVSFPIIGINPTRLALDLHNRYLALFFPLAAVFVVWVIFFFVQYWNRTTKRVFPATLILLLPSVFFVGTTTLQCSEEVQNMTDRRTFQGQMEVLYCKLFRYSQEQNIYPAPNAFIFRADKYYASFNEDYITGKVALFGGSRIGVFRDFIHVNHPEARFIETENGWYSIDGQQKDQCVMELGQTETPQQNYRNCVNQPMSRKVFD